MTEYLWRETPLPQAPAQDPTEVLELDNDPIEGEQSLFDDL
jgi:hypothetical protein